MLPMQYFSIRIKNNIQTSPSQCQNRRKQYPHNVEELHE